MFIYISIRHYSAIGLTLIIIVVGLSQLDIGRLGLHGFELIRLAWSDWNNSAVLLFTLALIVYIVSTSCTHCSLFHILILIHPWQLIVNCATTHIHLPRFKRGANIFGPSNWIDNPQAGFCARVLV